MYYFCPIGLTKQLNQMVKNMAKKKLNTEENILNEARKVFMQNGYDGTSMQMIADVAGINKSLLHYYYRSKERLFGKVFSSVFSQFLPRMEEIFMSEANLEEKIHAFVDSYIKVFMEHPLIPIFVMQELSKNPEHLAELMQDSGVNPKIIIEKINEELKAEGIKLKDPKHFLVNLIGLCVFPFAARPLIQNMLFQNDDKAYHQFLEERKKEVPEFIINAIRKG
jgi:AcrR family transcriptional regulator